jgi:hypothetical protein
MKRNLVGNGGCGGMVSVFVIGIFVVIAGWYLLA